MDLSEAKVLEPQAATVHPDHLTHAALARLTQGLSPATAAVAWHDWALHLAMSPSKQWHLAEKASRKWNRLLLYASRAGNEDCPACIEPLPQDKRFADPAWQRWPFNLAMRCVRRTLIAVCIGLLAPLAVPAGTDLHAYWDARCRTCHGESGPFARSTLRVDTNGRLLGRHHGADLERFLRQHYLTDDLVRPVSAMLAAQVVTPPLYRQQCAGCHGAASEFARRSLALREDGTLVGRKSGRAVQDHLRSHGGLEPAQVPEMVKTLTRVLGEVGGPTPR
jgi:hypothetical protein